MKKALIHIGTGKTGTTTIQNSLKKSGLDKFNICYPTFSTYKNNPDQNWLSILIQPFDRKPRGYNRFLKPQFEALKKRVDHEFTEQVNKYSQLLISAEFLGNFSTDEVISLKNYLNDLGYSDIRVIVYVRNPASYYLSLAQQIVKASHILPKPDSFKYNFKGMIEKWGSNMTSITIRLYDHEVSKENGLLISFQEEINQFFDVKINLNAVEKQNTSLSLEGLLLLKKYRETFYAESQNVFMPDSNKLLALLNDNVLSQTHKLELKEDVRQAITNNHLEDLLWLQENYNLKFNDLNYSDVKSRNKPISNKPRDIFSNIEKINLVRSQLEVLNYLLQK